ncbi:MAG: hypothetical protein HY703_03615 [Gemmatimonadetes bacterium]|nr:hypothetical protein [Gemmatimonadota bacterium]
MERSTCQRVAAVALALAALIPACDAPTAPEPPGLAPRYDNSGATLLECPTTEPRSVDATINGLGGTFSLDGHSITLPAGAVPSPTLFRLIVPASSYMEVEITAVGLDSFIFQAPVSIRLSYARCTQDLSSAALTAWHIDTQSKALLENMSGADDKASRTMTFSTGHLSSYAVAN